jgi:hypothetical protein
MVPDLVGDQRSGFLKGLLNGWQFSGISTFQSGQYIRLRFEGDLSGADMCPRLAGDRGLRLERRQQQQRLRGTDSRQRHQHRRHEPGRPPARHWAGRHTQLP